VIAYVLQPLIDVEEWTLEALHSLGLGWGLAIVGLTVLVRLSTVPLVIRQAHAQHRLRGHLPELQRLRERHKHDRERLQLELQEYYRRHGISPVAAFLPVLVQIPIFVSLYYLMREDVASETFGDAGFLFIHHLTERPHGAVLLALVFAYLCSQITNSVIAARKMQRAQRTVMVALPVLFVGVVARFPAGLAVYWITTSLWSLGQQIALRRVSPVSLTETDPIPRSDPADTRSDGFEQRAPARLRRRARRRRRKRKSRR
jgi:YidC/Oxa1 family membrane protein insertase